MNDKRFVLRMIAVKNNAWLSFSAVVENFLGNFKAPNYRELEDELLDSFQKLGCIMSVKVHCMYRHLNYFPENLGAMSEDQGERFHQDLKTMEKRYQGRWNKNMMADYCWGLKKNETGSHSRKAKKRKFLF